MVPVSSVGVRQDTMAQFGNCGPRIFIERKNELKDIKT